MRRSTLFAVATVLALAGCAQQPGPMAANPYPPPPQSPAEQRPLPPVSSVPLVWQPGHYDWNGQSYAFVPGTYVQAAGHTAWSPGYWSFSNGQWLWVPAHWAG